MKTRIVVWGESPDNRRVLLAIGLIPNENRVDIFSIPEEDATEILYNQLMNQWRIGQEVPLPESSVHIERPLTVSESILPDEIKVERTDIVQRAQTGWHFVVLSEKLFQSYLDELDGIKEKVHQAKHFDKALWEELKAYWTKVEMQIREKNLFRDHARKIKDRTNVLFDRMKELRKALDQEFKQESHAAAAAFNEKIASVEERIDKGMGLQPLFEELKDIQREFKDIKMTRSDKRKVWNRLDKAFKTIKEKRYGPGYKKAFSPLERIKRRYDGLIGAIGKMERSIARDEKEIAFQDRRIERTDGQLESQLRKAKQEMIAVQISSKKEKLSEMLKTKKELEDRMEKEKIREEKQREKEELEKAKKEVKRKIAQEIQETAEEHEGQAELLEKAADALSEIQKPVEKAAQKSEPGEKDTGDREEAEAEANKKKGVTENTDTSNTSAGHQDARVKEHVEDPSRQPTGETEVEEAAEKPASTQSPAPPASTPEAEEAKTDDPDDQSVKREEQGVQIAEEHAPDEEDADATAEISARQSELPVNGGEEE